MKELPLRKELRFRLVKHMTFLENELKDYEIFRLLSWKEYNTERSKRRDVERWIENIINSSIDLAKIILTHEGLPLPDTYKATIAALSAISCFDEKNMEKLSRWVRLRNIISHEYLDIRWASVKRFVSESKPSYEDFSKRVKKYLDERSEKE